MLGIKITASPTDLPLPDEDFDACLFYDKDLILAKECEKRWKTVNSSQAIAVCDDKGETYSRLNGVLPQLKTHVMPLCFGHQRREEYWQELNAALSFPMILKERKNSFGAGVRIVQDLNEVKSLTDKMDGFLLQEAGEFGRDVRIFLAGGKLIGAMERVNKTDFRSNCELGADAFPYPVSESELQIAKDAFTQCGLYFGGADIIRKGAKSYLLELNSNAGFQKMDTVLSQDTAFLILQQLLIDLSRPLT